MLCLSSGRARGMTSHGQSAFSTAESLGRHVRRHGGQPLPWDSLRLERLEGQPGRQQGSPGGLADVGTRRGVDLSDRCTGYLGLRRLRDDLCPDDDPRRPHSGSLRSEIWRHAGWALPGGGLHSGRVDEDVRRTAARVRCPRRNRHGVRIRRGHAGGGEVVWPTPTRAGGRVGGRRLRRGCDLHLAAGQEL